MIPKNAQDLFPPCRKTLRHAADGSALRVCDIDESGQATFLPIAWLMLAASCALIVAVLSGVIPSSGAVPAMSAVAFAGYVIVRSALVARP